MKEARAQSAVALAVAAACLCWLAFGGCGSDRSLRSTGDGAVNLGGGGGAGGAPTDGAADTVGDGACTTPASRFFLETPACNSLMNGAPAVPFTARSTPLPEFTGGAVRDGKYEATLTEGYAAAGTHTGRRMTLAVMDGATRMLWNGEVLDETASTVVQTLALDMTFSAAADGITFIGTECMSTAASPLAPVLKYTATADSLVVGTFDAMGGGVATTYTRRGCP